MPKCKLCKHLQLLNEKYYWCERINDSPDINAEHDCEDFKRATNYDVAKRMTIEELAELMTEPRCDLCEFGGSCADVGCVQGMINWLRKEVDE